MFVIANGGSTEGVTVVKPRKIPCMRRLTNGTNTQEEATMAVNIL
jgi:hypothetical protein